jgi:ABC-type branched-subunit amino acid transport system ATPase component
MTTEANDHGAIELAGLTKEFGHALAVDDLSLRIERGCTFGLIGPNGGGQDDHDEDAHGHSPAHGGDRHGVGP